MSRRGGRTRALQKSKAYDMIRERAEMIGFDRLGGLYPAFLEQRSGEMPAGEELRDLSRFSADHRDRLVEGILDDLERWGASPAAVASAQRLADERATAVVTGQQAGIAGGPLYTIWKAVGAVRAAARLEEANPGRAVVPVFWIEGEDHDFDEVRSVGLLERSGDFRSLAYDDGDEAARRVADRRVDPAAWKAFRDDLLELLGSTDFTDELVGLIDDSWGADGVTLVDGFARFLYRLLGEETPLVLLSATSPKLRALASEILEAEALDPEGSHAAVVAGTERAAAAGLPTPIDPRPGHLFILHQGERSALDPEGEAYRIRRTGELLTREEVAGIARRNPERLSGNVALRPVVQDAILPTVLYLGGPGELAYLAQLDELYRHLGIPQPHAVPRPFVLLVEPKVERTLESDGVTIAELIAGDFDPVSRVVDEETEKEIERVSREGSDEIDAIFSRFDELIGSIDPTLEKAAGAAATRATRELENLAGRLRGALKRTHETEINRLRTARAHLLPAESLQERRLSILHYLNRYGLDAVRRVLRGVESGKTGVQIVDIG